MSRIKTLEANQTTVLNPLNQSLPQMNMVKAEGPNEKLLKKLDEFHKINDTSREEFAEVWIRRGTAELNISKKQLSELIASSDAENIIKFIDEKVLSERRRFVKLSKIYGTISLLISILSVGGALLASSLSSVLFFTIGTFSFIFSGTEWCDALVDDYYTITRKQMKSKFGPDYFPIEEIKEELKLKGRLLYYT